MSMMRRMLALCSFLFPVCALTDNLRERANGMDLFCRERGYRFIIGRTHWCWWGFLILHCLLLSGQALDLCEERRKRDARGRHPPFDRFQIGCVTRCPVYVLDTVDRGFVDADGAGERHLIEVGLLAAHLELFAQ